MSDFSDTRPGSARLPDHVLEGFAQALPTEIDEFRIEGLLGSGSHGVVYLARQSRPARRVALKVLISAFVSPESLYRFEREVALMGSIEHPNIARLYGTGYFRNANFEHPYLAMERIEGLPLIEHAEAKALGVQARIALLATLAHAVHHVHSRGVVHRDLKPANILVDRTGTPKILDFGVARAADPEDVGVITQQGEQVGTLPYMAPEQLAGEAHAADLQVDIYALGVIAFELVTGALPYHPEAFRTVITAAQTLQHAPPEQQAMRAQVPRDLQLVIAKAMHGQRNLRYGSALELALDLERFLNQEPVLARAPSLAHSVRLFVQRRAALSAGIAIGVISLVAALGLSTYFANREAVARAQADLRAEELAATNTFMEEILTGADPSQNQGKEILLRDVLAQTGKRVEEEYAHRPAVALRAALMIGNTWLSLNQPDMAYPMLRKAVERVRRTPGLDVDLVHQAEVTANLLPPQTRSEPLQSAQPQPRVR